MKVEVRGSGVAAACCLKLLVDHGIAVTHTLTDRAHGPTLLVNATTQKLICDVFASQPDQLFGDGIVIRRRVVLWGDASDPVSLPHYAIAIEESKLLDRLLARATQVANESSDCSWCINSSRDLGAGKQLLIGERRARIAFVHLQDRQADACWMESVDNGWLFLVPTGGGQASMVVVAHDAESALKSSRLVIHQIRDFKRMGTDVPSSPAILDALSGDNYIACGSAAVRFDPICGEGAGHAVREAILASAVVKAASTLRTIRSGTSLYDARIYKGFERHLQLCRRFYESGGRSEWWRSQTSVLLEGLTLVRKRLDRFSDPQFPLRGFDLDVTSAAVLSAPTTR